MRRRRCAVWPRCTPRPKRRWIGSSARTAWSTSTAWSARLCGSGRRATRSRASSASTCQPGLTQVASGGDSLVIYDLYRETGELSFLDAIRDYNRDDCLSTLLLRDWLIDRARETGRWPPPPSPEPDEPAPKSEEEQKQRLEREAREATQAELETALVPILRSPMPMQGSSWPILSAFTGARRSRLGGPSSTGRSAGRPSSRTMTRCLGGCVATEEWIGQEKQSLTFRYHYPEQETKLREGSAVHLAATGEAAGTILSLNEAARVIVLKRGKAKGELPREVSLIPGWPLKTDILRSAVWAEPLT